MKATLCVFVALVAVTTANPGNTGTNLPMCTPSTAANPGVAVPAACSCGSDGVAVPAGRFCGLKADGRGTMLDVPTCPTAKTDGKSSPSAHCNCGTEFWKFISPGEFCLVTTGVTGTKRYTPLGITSPTAGPTFYASGSGTAGSDSAHPQKVSFKISLKDLTYQGPWDAAFMDAVAASVRKTIATKANVPDRDVTIHGLTQKTNRQ